jgi:hypothetical protein
MRAPAKLRQLMPEPCLEQRISNEAAHFAALCFDLGACRTAEEAEAKADALEDQQAAWASQSPPHSNAAGVLGLVLTGDFAWRASLYRARAEELRR